MITQQSHLAPKFVPPLQKAATKESLIDAAFEYAYPLYVMATTRHRAVVDRSHAGWHPANTVRHERDLSDPSSRWITTPNNDTLYSNAWLDLSRGPVEVALERMPAGRYWSVALLDAFTNHVAIVGSQRFGAAPVRFTVTGPGQQASAQQGIKAAASVPTVATSEGEAPVEAGHVIAAPGYDVWLFARFLVDGPSDLVQARAMQDGLRVRATTGPADDRPTPTHASDAANFLAVVNDSLGRNPAPAGDAPLLKAWEPIGLHPGRRDAWMRLDPSLHDLWTARAAAGMTRLASAGARHRRTVQGWITSGAEIGNFSTNYALRASVAHGGLGALPPSEAIYFVRFEDDASQALDGRHSYVLRVPAEGLAVGGFWSLSMYQPVDGRRHFVANPINRYAIGNRTPGLLAQADGSLEIVLQHNTPSRPRDLANWLPTPQGPFQIALRAYLPGPALRDGQARMPGITRME